MKKCPKNCGTFEDYETKCPKCGARLLKMKSVGQSGTSGFYPNTSQPIHNTSQNSSTHRGSNSTAPVTNSAPVSSDRGYDFGRQSGGNVGQSRFSYDTHIYGMSQSGGNVNVSSTSSQNATNQTTSHPASTPSPVYQNKNRFRGKVKNLREDVSPMGKGESIVYSVVHGTHMTQSDKTFNFQLIEVDQNDNQTGVIYSITFRGEILAGHFYDGNIVIVEGKRARTGEIYAKNIYNETSNCAVKMRTNLFPF